jgi:hypothetical protein
LIMMHITGTFAFVGMHLANTDHQFTFVLPRSTKPTWYSTILATTIHALPHQYFT